MFDGLEFRHLESFVAVAEECSFGKAAERLNISQPSLSAQIKQLEHGVHANLFVRSQTGVLLTRPGARFLVFARQIIHMKHDAVRATAYDKAGNEWPLRFGFSPFADHQLVDEAVAIYRELVPGGLIQPSSECSAELTTMVADGRLDAAIVSLPVTEKDLFVRRICQESMLVCLRRDDPLAGEELLPRNAIAGRLSILFARVHQPLFYDSLSRQFARAGIELNPSEFVSAPADLQFLVKSGHGLGLLRESTRLDPALTMRRIAGMSLAVTTGFICQLAQSKPVLPMLAYRLQKQSAAALKIEQRKRPNEHITGKNLEPNRRQSQQRLSA